MGYQEGSVFVYKRKLWLFAGYGDVKNFIQYIRLHGLHGEVLEVPLKECYFLLSPDEVDFNQVEQELGN